jgi:hypothetical protein
MKNDTGHQNNEKPPSLEYRTFTKALSLAISVLKDDLKQRLKQMKGEKVY